MNTTDDTSIAGLLTSFDWGVTKQKLVKGSATIWRSAFNDYFIQRINLRYLAPIRTLQLNCTNQGEGFSIVTIQCSLIEFLESTAKGTTYQYSHKGQKLGHYNYSSSKDIFVAFLSNRLPFSNTFDADAALDFYINVRCGLLHEARTKGGWKIRAGSHNSNVADVKNRIVYRNNFQRALLEYINLYGTAIELDKTLQEAFIRKFDSLCV